MISFTESGNIARMSDMSTRKWNVCKAALQLIADIDVVLYTEMAVITMSQCNIGSIVA